MKRRLWKLLGVPRAVLHITCPHGEFIASTHRPGKDSVPHTCNDCGFAVRVTWQESTA